LPDGLRDSLIRIQGRAAARELFLEQEIAQDLNALAEARIETLLLKGTALAYTLYPAPELRPRCDVDILLRDKEAANQAWQLLKARGHERSAAVSGNLVSHQYSCARKVTADAGVVLDVHWKISNSNFFAQKFSFDKLHAQRIAVPALGPNAYALDPVHALIHALLHRIGHLGSSALERLIWIYDLDLICRGLEPEQWDALTEQVKRLELGPICRDGLQRTRELFNTPLPDGLMKRLEPADRRAYQQLALKHSNIRRTIFELRSLGSWGRRIRYLRETIFPDADYMRARFGASGRLGLALAYVRRFKGGIHKRLFRTAELSEHRNG
jgi:hypothetical protein